MKNDQLPKGMSLPEAPELKQPVPFHLGRGNYVAAIYQAIESLPVEVIIYECTVTEHHGQDPKVQLTLRIVGEKEMRDGDND